MPDRPLILFPTPERADRETKPHSMNVSVTPPVKRQFSRLQPTFKALKTAFDQKKYDYSSLLPASLPSWPWYSKL